MSRRNLRSFSSLVLAFLLIFPFTGCGGEGGGPSGTPSPPPPLVSWRGTQQFGTTGDDIGYRVTLDRSANAYITGSSNGNLDGNISAGLSDIFLVKFNSADVKQ
jgi:hypothetical protein